MELSDDVFRIICKNLENQSQSLPILAMLMKTQKSLYNIVKYETNFLNLKQSFENERNCDEIYHNVCGYVECKMRFMTHLESSYGEKFTPELRKQNKKEKRRYFKNIKKLVKVLNTDCLEDLNKLINMHYNICFNSLQSYQWLHEYHRRIATELYDIILVVDMSFVSYVDYDNYDNNYIDDIGEWLR